MFHTAPNHSRASRHSSASLRNHSDGTSRCVFPREAVLSQHAFISSGVEQNECARAIDAAAGDRFQFADYFFRRAHISGATME